LLGFGLNLAGCGGFVADHWPHWAGGMPADVPPRPGSPGYAEFIAHGQPTPEPKQEPGAAVQGSVQQDTVQQGIVQQGIVQQGIVQQGIVQQGAAAPVSAAAAPPATPVRAAVPDSDVPQDSNVVNGGLY
jgi:hypothetical protein